MKNLKLKSLLLPVLLLVMVFCGTALAQPKPPGDAPAPVGRYGYHAQAQIAPEAAEKTAFTHVGGGVLTKLHFKVDKRGRAKYDVHIFKDGDMHKLDIDAVNGQILKYEMKAPEMERVDRHYNVGISRARAEQIAKERAGGGTVIKSDLKYKKKKSGHLRYNIDLVNGDMKYEFKIDAHTGTVYEFEQKNIRRI